MCTQNDVDFSHLATDLASVATTPNLSFITPNVCHDGHDSPCVDGEPGGLWPALGWLQDEGRVIAVEEAVEILVNVKKVAEAFLKTMRRPTE